MSAYESGTVGIAYLHTGMVHHDFMESLVGTIMYDINGAGRLRDLHAISDPYIPQGRCMAVEQFLEKDAEWLWFLDYDIKWTPDVLDKLLAVADPEKSPVVSALYLAHFHEAFRPCWLLADGTVIETHEYMDMRDNESVWPLELAGCGMGCTLIHRTVLEAMYEEAQKKELPDPWPWFGHDMIRKQDGSIERLGEDLTFGFRAKKTGATIWGIPVEVGHRKSVPITIDTPDIKSR